MFKLQYIQIIFFWTAISFIIGAFIYIVAKQFYPEMEWAKWIPVYFFCGLGFGTGRAYRKFKKMKD